MKRTYAMAGCAALVAALFGCRSSPPDYFYTLKSTAQSAPATPAAEPLSIVVGPVTIPAIVDRPQMVAYRGNNQVTLAEQSRWAEPVVSAVPRVIAEDLSKLLGAQVSTVTTQTLPDPRFRVALDVQRFEAVLGQAVTVEVLWTVSTPKSGPRKTGRSVVNQPAGGADYGSVVAAFDAALAAVSGEIAAAIRAMPPG